MCRANPACGIAPGRGKPRPYRRHIKAGSLRQSVISAEKGNSCSSWVQCRARVISDNDHLSRTPHLARYTRQPLPQGGEGIVKNYLGQDTSLPTFFQPATRRAPLPHRGPGRRGAGGEGGRSLLRSLLFQPTQPIPQAVGVTSHPARGVYPEPLRSAKGRSQRNGEWARHPFPKGARAVVCVLSSVLRPGSDCKHSRCIQGSSIPLSISCQKFSTFSLMNCRQAAASVALRTCRISRCSE